jgi:hypothetical protein
MEQSLSETKSPFPTAHTSERKKASYSHMKTPPELDRITDVVLAYKPKPKSKAMKKRARKKKRDESKG